LMKSISDAVENAYHIGDTLVFIREHQVNNVSMNGVPQADNPKIKEVLLNASKREALRRTEFRRLI